MQNLLLFTVVGGIAQLIDGSLGMAYGVSSTTLLVWTGLAPAVASASVHLAEMGTTLASGVSHWRLGNVDWRTVRLVALPGAIGAFSGAVALTSVSAGLARPWVAGILLTLGVYILLRFSSGRTFRSGGRPYVRHRYLALLGLAAGFIDASGGGGWGPVATPTLMATGKMEPRKVIGSVDTSEFIVAAAASVGFLAGLGSHHLDFAVIGLLLAGGLLAAPLAAWLVRRVRPRLLGCTVGGFIIFTNLGTILGQAGVAGLGATVVYSLATALWAAATARVVRAMRRERFAAGHERGPGNSVRSADVIVVRDLVTPNS